jgi:hypothetical protein
MSEPTGFHVRHDLHPNLTRELLTLLQALPSGQSTKQLREASQARGYKLGERKEYNKLLKSLGELGLLTSHREPIRLSETGSIVARMATFYPHLLPEFVHFLYYASWDHDQDKRFSWSYRTVCNTLWSTSPCTIDRDYLVNLVTQEAIQIFNLKGISFSTSSVAGILNWLAELQPPCISSQSREHMFLRRNYCSVELFALALSHVYKFERDGNVFLSLTPQLRERICQICLVDPEVINEMFDQTETCFPKLQIRRERGERFAMLDFSWADIAEQDILV